MEKGAVNLSHWANRQANGRFAQLTLGRSNVIGRLTRPLLKTKLFQKRMLYRRKIFQNRGFRWYDISLCILFYAQANMCCYNTIFYLVNTSYTFKLNVKQIEDDASLIEILWLNDTCHGVFDHC